MEIISNFIFSEDSDSFSCFNKESNIAENVKYHLLKPPENSTASKVQALVANSQAQEKSSYKRPTNLLANRCHYCHINPTIYEMLELAGIESQPQGHCYGVSLFFIKFFLEHPDKLHLPLKDLLQEFLEHPEFELLSHEFQKLQHSFLRLKGEKQPLELNVNAMKKYFLILSGHPVETYLPITNEVLEGRQVTDVLDDVLLLEKNRLLMIGVRSQSGEGHCIVVSLKGDNLMIYNSNIGLYRFSNLFEAKEYLLGYFSVMYPTWYASFSDDL